MESIFSNCETMQHTNKKIIRGYVVHIYDNTNFDIDLGIVDQFYARALTQEYDYVDTTKSIMLDTLAKGNNKINSFGIAKGMAYRCRVKGVGVKKAADRAIFYKIMHNISHYINQCDGWVDCILCGMDKYDRILVEIYIPSKIEKNPICLSEYLYSQNPTKTCYYNYDN